MAERTIAALHLSGAGNLGEIARATVASGATELGLEAGSGEALAAATALVVEAVAGHAFDMPDDVEIDVELLRRDDAVVARIDDQGLPFAFRDEGGAFEQAMSSALVDEVHHRSRGEDGNRTELVRHTDDDTRDIRTNADIGEHLEAVAAEEVDSSVAVTVRAMELDDAEGVARLTWRTYGYTYQHHEFYRPDLVRQVLADGTMRSWVGVAGDGEVVGHVALVVEQADSLVAEGGRAMVDPRYRGHHVMKQMVGLRGEFVGQVDLYGIFADSVTAHTASQKLYGGPEQPVTGVLLGYLPPTVAFRRIHRDDTAARRQAVVMSYHPRREHEELTVYPPAVATDVLRRIYDAHDLPRPFGAGRAPDPGSTSRIESREWRDIGSALIIVDEPGADLRDVVRARLRSMRGIGIEVVYADLPLAHPGTPAAGAVLNDLGFAFGGVIPLLRDGSDVLRMQHVGDLDVVRDEIQLVSTMAQDLLDFILERRDATC